MEAFSSPLGRNNHYNNPSPARYIYIGCMTGGSGIKWESDWLMDLYVLSKDWFSELLTAETDTRVWTNDGECDTIVLQNEFPLTMTSSRTNRQSTMPRHYSSTVTCSPKNHSTASKTCARWRATEGKNLWKKPHLSLRLVRKLWLTSTDFRQSSNTHKLRGSEIRLIFPSSKTGANHLIEVFQC